ncbi:MAG TPA: hypothetical protein PLP19_14430 [bacterium]|nr:hypothetical protein [bacterium]HPN44687.1 hypothetical protein [bacterium]
MSLNLFVIFSMLVCCAAIWAFCTDNAFSISAILVFACFNYMVRFSSACWQIIIMPSISAEASVVSLPTWSF